MKEQSKKSGVKRPKSSIFVCGCALFCLVGYAFLSNKAGQTALAEDVGAEIVRATYARQEFFGAQALVPLPAGEARENLARLAESRAGAEQILEKLAELDEKLSRFEEAEKNLIRLAEIDGRKLEALAAFYRRRAEYRKEAEVRRTILFSIDAERRGPAFEQLIELARKHDLKEYLQKDFYGQAAAANPNVYEIFEKLIDHLSEEKNYAEALDFVRQARLQFPARKSVLLEKEIGLLLATNNPAEAEEVYQAAFDPFWPDEEARRFYDFLSDRDRLRAYGAEMRARLRKDPADFDAAVRLALYRNYDYSYGNDQVAPIILRLEQAKKSWSTEELVTVTRLLLGAGEADPASRFLYTLYAREDFQKNGELRAKVLYQLFEMFSDAADTRLPLTKGDLRFYEDVALADTKPGIATGLLSLIFADTDARRRLGDKENEANTHFNRAAAFRIFEEYKKESPASPELAQMYLDVVRLYTATGETEIAEKTLSEFAENFHNSADYPDAALKLADAFVAAGKNEKARETYQKALDRLGEDTKNKRAASFVFPVASLAETNARRNEGIAVPHTAPPGGYVGDDGVQENKIGFRDYLARKTSEITYEEVLETLVASLAKEKRTTEILQLYSNEINKYPDEEWLYERRLAWLEQTNLTEEQLGVYQTALARFRTRGWQDRLARFFLRHDRNEEFAALSEDLVAKLSDAEIQNYLSQFVDGGVSAKTFQKHLYLKLYQAAHARFPRNPAFVAGLLRFYRSENRESDWRQLAAEYYFEHIEAREQFLDNLARKGELRAFVSKAGESHVYELFRADAAVRLSNFEAAVEAYRRLNALYPHDPRISARLTNLTRSFGQKNRRTLVEASEFSRARADFAPSSAAERTRSGEIYAELGDDEKARQEWEKLIDTGAGSKETYADAATVYWDYFQYEDARRTITNMRAKFADRTLYAFEAGAILEAERRPSEAIAEYVRALDAGGDETQKETQKEKAKRRLAVLHARGASGGGELEEIAQNAYASERAKRADASFLSLGYAEFLFQIERADRAESVLRAALAGSRNQEFLRAARDFCQSADNETCERAALTRLAEVSSSSRQEIACRLQLAESFAENGEPEAAKNILSGLVRKFPTNYGVVSEASDFYYRMGFEAEAADVLETALAKSRGRFQTILAQKLAKRLLRLDRVDRAEQILAGLHAEDKADTEIFRELAKIYVRTNKPEALRRAFDETIRELKNSDEERREIETLVADFRREMIDAFTRLKDYGSAVEQHIEIINREPENELLTENAVAYAKRYGGAETLLNYYLKLSEEAFKNYRWNVVLARIYEAGGDWENASKNYRSAIDNQPEMAELYLSVAEIETRRNRFDAALAHLDTALELTGGEALYLKKKIEILNKAGRTKEALAEKAKLPAEKEPKIAAGTFEEARKLDALEKEKARGLFREAFGKLLENPLEGELKAADIDGYVRSARAEESLASINNRLWLLREKLIEVADQFDSAAAGAARRRLGILDAAMTESVGPIARSVGTDDELALLHDDLEKRLAEISFASDHYQTVSLLQNLSRRAGFGDLEEKTLLKKLDQSAERKLDLQNLLSFYKERGAYQKSFEALEKYESADLSLTAETARLAGWREKELEALRAIYQKPAEKFAVSPNRDVERYLEILARENPSELKSLTEKNSAFQLQLINFLLGRGERELAHAAVKSAELPVAWKASRGAEISLALKEFDDAAECYFCDALQLDSIGNFIKQTPDKKRFLINDEWFRLARQYGEWLYERKDEEVPPGEFLTALTERLPQNAGEQTRLGAFYLEKNEFEAAAGHFRLALELDDSDRTARAGLGTAFYRSGRRELAENVWADVLDEDGFQSNVIFFRILRKNDLAAEARERLSPLIVVFLETKNASDNGDFETLIREIAASFASETEKTAYFRQLVKRRPTDTSLAAMLLGESLIAEGEQKEFYELLIERGDPLTDSDYQYSSTAARAWAISDAEAIYDAENEYQTEEPESERFEWQKKHLELLIKTGDDAGAARSITRMEKELNGRFARPAWLRLASLRLEARAGKFDRERAERLVGITVPDSATEIKPPSLERFNKVLQILNEENQPAEAERFSEAFFARMLALGLFDAANFSGLARAFFQRGETEKALRVLRLMIDAGDPEKRETALAEIVSTDVVKARTADAAKLPENASKQSFTTAALALAADVAAASGLTRAAVDFRRELAALDPSDRTNRIELARLFSADGRRAEAADLLREIVDDRDAPRLMRWQARSLRRETGESVDFPDAPHDPFSQFYQANDAADQGDHERAAEFFIKSLIAENEAENPARTALVRTYILLNKPYAALKLAETDRSAKPDELLQMLSEAAEKVGDYAKALEYEKAKRAPDPKKTHRLRELADQKNRRATDLTIDLENTRRL